MDSYLEAPIITDEDLERFHRFAHQHMACGGVTDILATQVSALVDEIRRLHERIDALQADVQELQTGERD